MFTLKQRLIELRQLIEEEADLCEVEVPAVLLLSDVCIALDMEEVDRLEVLGPRGASYVEALANGQISLCKTTKTTTFRPVHVSSRR